MNIRTKQRLAHVAWPRYSQLVDLVNRNALLWDWTKQHSNVRHVKGRTELFRYVSESIIGNNPIDYLEFGVFRGVSTREWCSFNTHPESRFYGFDTFTGMPESRIFPAKGLFDTHGEIPDIADKRVSFIKGLFQDTLKAFLKGFVRGKRLLVLLDAELYTSTLYVLTVLDPLLLLGDIILFNDFSDPTGDFRAYSDYLSSYRVDLKPVCMVTEKGFAVRVAFIFGRS